MKRFAVIIYFVLIVFIPISAQNFILHSVPDDASCFSYYITDVNQNRVSLPENIQKKLECTSVASIHDNGLVFYSKNQLQWYNITTQKTTSWVRLNNDIDGVSNPIWCPNGKKVMFTVINQQKKYGYKEPVRIIVLGVNENGKVTSKQQFDRPVNFVCGSLCSSFPEEDFRFIGDNTIAYKRHELISDRLAEWETIEIK